MILYCCGDLLWASKIKGTGEATGIPCRPVRSVEMLEARLGDSPVKGLMVDLEAGEVAIALIRRMREDGRPVKVVAFGPHVDVAALSAAKAAGADAVMTRGAVARGLPELLAKLESGGGAVASVMEE